MTSQCNLAQNNWQWPILKDSIPRQFTVPFYAISLLLFLNNVSINKIITRCPYHKYKMPQQQHNPKSPWPVNWSVKQYESSTHWCVSM